MEIGELVKLKESSPAVNKTYRSLDRGKFDSEKNLAARNAPTKVYYVESSEPLSLSDFSKKNDFPSVLKVDEGQASLSHSFSFGSDQGLIRMGPVTIPLGVDRMFVALEKKIVEVATCKDLASKRTYQVPIKSCCIDVVPLHNAEWQDKGKKVRLLNFWKCRSLPKVVRATKDFVMPKGRTVCSGTLLFPQEVKKKRKNGLQECTLVAKIEDGSIVELTAASGLCGTFSIDSSDIRISLFLAAQCCKLPFACTLQPCNDETFLPFRVNVERVEKSEVISGIMKVTEGPIQDDIYNCEHVYEVPVNLDLKVTVMKQKVERAAIDTKPVTSSWVHPPDESASCYIEMIKGTALVSSQTGKSKANTVNSKVSGSLDFCKPMDRSNDKHNQENYPKYSEKQKPSIPSVVVAINTAMFDPSKAEMMTEIYCEETLKLNVDCDKIVSESVDEEEHDYSSLDGEEHVYSSVDEEEHQYATTEEAAEYECSFADREHFQKLNEFTVDSDQDLSYDDNNEYTYVCAESDQEFSDYDYPERKPDEGVYDCTTATTALKSLDMTGVLHLLDAMNLGMYRENFEAAMIDGNVFSRLTDDWLSQLGVKLSLHRLRLLHVIKGVKTVESIFSTLQSTSGEQNCPREVDSEVPSDARVNKTTERTPNQQAIDGGECNLKESQHQANMQPLHEVDTAVSVPGRCVKACDEGQFIRPLAREDLVPGGITSIPGAIDRMGAQCVSNSETYDIQTNAHSKTSLPSNVHGTSTSTIAKFGWHFDTSDPEIIETPRSPTGNRTNTVSSLISKFEVARVVCGHAPDKTLEKNRSNS